MSAIALLAGILLATYWQRLPTLVIFGLVGLFFKCASTFKQKVLLLPLLLGLFLTVCTLQQHQLRQLPPAWEKQRLMVDGQIVSIPARQGRGQTFLLRIDKTNMPGLQPHLPMQARLSWYGSSPVLQLGQRWSLAVKLKRPRGLANPGTFDYERYLFVNNIGAQGYVEQQVKPQYRGNAAWYAVHLSWRQHVLTQLEEALAPSNLRGLIKAITLGTRNEISDRDWQAFRQTGTSHLFAISGLHVGLCASFVFLLLRTLWSGFALTLQRYGTALQAAALGAWLAATLYSILAGFSLPTQRALCMLTVAMAALLYKRFITVWRTLGYALFAVLLLDPLALWASSFYLSFLAVVLLVYFSSARSLKKKRMWRWLRMQLGLTVGLAPLTLYFFGQTAVVGGLANVVAIPWVALIIMPLSLVACLCCELYFPLGQALLQLDTSLFAYLLKFIYWMAALPAANYNATLVDMTTLSLAVVGVCLLLSMQALPGKWLGLFCLLPWFFPQHPSVLPGQVNLTVLDVGQGLACVIQTQHHVLLYDTGPSYGATANAGTRVILPFLQYQRRSSLDALVVSHGDDDHSGGAKAVLAQLPVAVLWTSVPQKFPGKSARLCIAGNAWQWEGVHFEFLYPTKAQLGLGNNSSCVLRITSAEHSILLTGDIERKAERYLLTHAPKLSSEIMLAPHHGSLSSSSVAFIKAVAPKVVVFATGYLNRFRFPHVKIDARYQQQGVARYNTTYTGALTVKLLPGASPVISQYRQQPSAFWQAQ